MRYLVTGGAGFIGSNLVQALLEKGQDVRVLDNFSTGRRENLVEISDCIEVIEGDVGDIETCWKACTGADVVLHQAALPSVPRSIQDPLATHRTNSQGTLNMLVAARDAEVRRFVFASSSSVYGDGHVLPKRETMPTNPVSPYAVSKLNGEQNGRVFHCVYGLETVALRYFNVFGPRQNPESDYAAVVPKFTSRMLNGQQPIIFGDGEQSRDFTFVDNVVLANLLAAEAPAEAVTGEVFNIAAGTSITLNELVGELRRQLDVDIEPVYADPRPGEVRHSQADTTRAAEALGYRPVVEFRTGLQLTIAAVSNARTP